MCYVSMQQFFGKTFKESIVMAAILYGLGFLAYGWDMGTGIILGLMFSSAFVAYKRLDRAMYLAFLELFINPHGVLISASIGGFPLSLRMAIFIGILAGWGIGLLTRRYKLRRADLVDQPHFGLLILAAAMGLIIGTLSRDPAVVFADGNAYLYLLYLLPMLSVRWRPQQRHDLLQVLAAGAVWVSGLSLLLLYAFSHLDASLLTPLYAFFRDLRIAEITALEGGLYRVFVQSQIFVMLFGLTVLSMVGTGVRRSWLVGLGALSFGIVLLSLSRSFWVGLTPAVLFMLWTLWRSHRPTTKQTFGFVGWTLVAKIAAAVGLVAIVLFPFPPQDLTSSALVDSLKERTTDSDDVAISSRWKLLWPMLGEIAQSPLVGHGFGATVTFQTDDPRARAINPDGTWTTYSMEWGWFELWIKMGVIGPLAFLYAGWELIRRLQRYRWTDQAWLGYALMAGVILIFATHVFSPYLNHPIGLGYLLFIVPFIANKKPATATVEEFVPAPVKGTPAKALASRQ